MESSLGLVNFLSYTMEKSPFPDFKSNAEVLNGLRDQFHGIHFYP